MKSTTKPKKKAKSIKPQKPVKAQEYLMPIEVRDWIEQASSRLQRLSSEVDRLKVENAELKAYRKFAEKRILRSEHED